MGQVVEHLSPEFKPQYLQKKKKKTHQNPKKTSKSLLGRLHKRSALLSSYAKGILV
jgi:hypothetical protein